MGPSWRRGEAPTSPRRLARTRPLPRREKAYTCRMSDVDPWRDSLLKVTDAGVRKGDVLLDTFTGLGYTATASLGREASRVLTFEAYKDVLRLAELNP